MFETCELGRKVDKKTFAAREPDLREALLDAQFRLRSADFSVVVVIAGAEGAGKGETVELLAEWLDARHVETHALGPPSEEERLRPEYFRFWRRLPPAGSTAVFFGSWYTRPIRDHALGQLDDASLARATARISDFERMLRDEGVLLVKLWLHISKKQQAKRFEKLESNPETSWRVTPRDWEWQQTFDAFVSTATHVLRRTDTGENPWHVIEAWDARYRHLKVGETLLEDLEKHLDRPAPPEEPAEPAPQASPVNVLRVMDLSKRLDDDEYDELLDKYQARIGRLARKLTQAGKSCVLVFEGMDAAGKGGCIRRVIRPIDPRFYKVYPVSAPTDEERARPYLWRFWRRVPAQGRFAIFDRSWYGRVLVERIEGYCSPSDWRRAFSEINAFEQQLVDAGALVLKFWLQVSQDEQLRRFEAREETGHKRYKLTDEDWRNREKWPEYEAAVCDMLERTSSEIAPWTLVEAEDKRYARVKVAKTVARGLKRLLS